MAIRREIVPLAVGLLALGTVIGWLALNRFGLFDNAKMRRELERELKARDVDLGDSPAFVGFATPRYSSALDPHEDVGFLVLRPGRLEFVSEVRTVTVERQDIREIRFRPNIHSLLGLGRWVSIEGEVGGQAIRLAIEPRERRTLLGNRAYSKELRNRLAAWLKSA